jgi:uncharacterized protein YdhG (YjbR/CyaY superfamily)
MDDDVQAYIDAIDPDHRPLFDRMQRLILEVHPEADVVISYKMPTFKVGKNRCSVAAWKHGISIYGWRAANVPGFLARHPELTTSTGTIRISPTQAEGIGDDELREVIRASLGD